MLTALPRGLAQAARVADTGDLVEPDQIALRDDLVHAAELMGAAADDGSVAYIAQFLSGVALSAHDSILQDAASELARNHDAGMTRVNGLVRERLAEGQAF